ncbi:MAG: hypothetical protein AAGB46_09940, partial [Verrucomicrobiota bacterium]
HPRLPLIAIRAISQPVRRVIGRHQRNSANRANRESWVDLLKVMEKVGLPISEKQKRYFL